MCFLRCFGNSLQVSKGFATRQKFFVVVVVVSLETSLFSVYCSFSWSVIFISSIYFSLILWEIICIEIYRFKAITSQSSLGQDSSWQVFVLPHVVWSFSYDKDLLGDRPGCLDMLSVFPGPSHHGHTTFNFLQWQSSIIITTCDPPRSFLNLGLGVMVKIHGS